MGWETFFESLFELADVWCAERAGGATQTPPRTFCMENRKRKRLRRRLNGRAARGQRCAQVDAGQLCAFLTALFNRVTTLGLGRVAALPYRSLLHTRFSNISGVSFSEVAMRPNPRSPPTPRRPTSSRPACRRETTRSSGDWLSSWRWTRSPGPTTSSGSTARPAAGRRG